MQLVQRLAEQVAQKRRQVVHALLTAKLGVGQTNTACLAVSAPQLQLHQQRLVQSPEMHSQYQRRPGRQRHT